MSDFVLPKEVQYTTPAALPECQTQQVVLSPINTTSLGPSSLMQFDFPSKGYLIPETVYIRYKVTVENSGAADYTGWLRGTPVYSFINKLQTFIGGSTGETISNYHQTMNMMTNLQLDVAQKYGNQSALGYNGDANEMFEQDGRSYAATNAQIPAYNATSRTTGKDVFTVSAFLPFNLSLAEKLIPLHLMPGVRLELTTAAVSEIFYTQANTSINYTLSNVELCFDIVNFTNEADSLIASQGPIYIKTQSYQNIGTPVTQFSGNTEIVYNTRLASIKSLFAIFNPTYNSSGTNNLSVANGIFDSIDITSANGSLQWTVAATQYPTREVSTLNNKSAVFTELKKACGAMSTNYYNTSINIFEFSFTDAGFSAHVAADRGTLAPSSSELGKFYFGTNLEKVHTSCLLTGVSTQNSPLSLRINTGTRTGGSYMVYMIALFDQLLIIDPVNRNVEVKQ